MNETKPTHQSPKSKDRRPKTRLAMVLIVGLGNPGKEYEWSRHNLGFMLIDKLAGDAGLDVKLRECQSRVGRGEIEGCAVKLVKPQSYMNLSGEAVACLLAKHKLSEPGEKLLIVSDDLALPFGKIRIRARGSAGGHNGLKSIIGAVGTNEFTRLRIGIQPEHPISDSKRFVLDSFPGATRPAVAEILERSVKAVRAILRDGVLKAMTEYNSNE
ncbi:MAG: aminoacyl-tRNA hydrolase [Pyrinomonadaceae bacterium]